MTHWIDITNFAFAVGGWLTALLGLALNRFFTYQERRTRHFFSALFALILAYITSDIASQLSLLLAGPSGAAFSLAAVFLESLLSSMLMPLAAMYLLYCAGEKWRKRPVLLVISALWLVYAAMLVSTLFTSEIYTVTADNVYRRGPLYPVLLLPPIIMMAANLTIFLRVRKNLSPGMRKAFASDLLIPLFCMLVQAAAYGLLMIVIGTSVAAMLMFVLILKEQVDRYVRQQEENARQRSSIMVLQMRPHFIYNTMTSIYYLCKQDADKAQQVILDFTSYLRKNFTAVAREDLISFSEEMEHTRAYLAVEQVRFEGELFVEYDTGYTAFRLPPLTLQPVVENAVKHGIDPEREPLHIAVRTRRTEQGSEITVEDTGPGFNPAEQDEPGTALGNIRERLRLMCGGRMEIESRPGEGTRVTILIPDKNIPEE